MTTDHKGVRGLVVAGYEPVREQLEQFLERDPTYCAQFAVYRNGELVVDLVGGSWAGDALLPVFSCSKGVIAAAVALLIHRGELDLDRRVASYWPDFAAGGKGAITVRQLLSHQAGLPAVDGGYTASELLEHDPLAKRLAAQRPLWLPGAAFGYHAITIGVLADELIRRVTGRTLATILRDDITAPRGIDFHLGAPAELDERVVDMDMPLPEEMPSGGLPPSPRGSLGRLLGPTDAPPLWLWGNAVEHRRVGPPAAGGLATAKGLAGLYDALTKDEQLVSADVISQMTQIQVQGDDVMSGLPFRYGVVYQRPVLPRLDYGSYQAFGHDGLGGSLGAADPFFGLAFGYTVKRLPMPGGVDKRAVELMRTAREAVESAERDGPTQRVSPEHTGEATEAGRHDQ